MDDYKVDCTHDHIYLLEILIDRFSKIDEKEKGDEDEEEEEEEGDEEEGAKKELIKRKTPDEYRSIVLSVKYFNVDEIVPVDDPRQFFYSVDEMKILEELRMEGDPDKREEEEDDEEQEEDEEEEKTEDNRDDEKKDGNGSGEGREGGEGNEEIDDSSIDKIALEITGTLTPGIKFCAGKARLFPMKPSKLIERILNEPIKVKLYWKGDPRNPKEYIGETDIKLDNNFIELVTRTDDVTPVTTFTEEKYKLKNREGIEIGGFVKLFVRLSCFGKTVYHSAEQ